MVHRERIRVQWDLVWAKYDRVEDDSDVLHNQL
jgi:hypothetical protein